MDFFTHSVFGGLLYILFLKDVTFDYFFIALTFSVLPDIDIFFFPLKRMFKSNYLHHRGATHSYIVGIIISAILSIFFYFFGNKSFLMSWVIGSAFYGLHISMDLLTTTKMPLLYPLVNKEYCLYIERSGSTFTFINSLLFITIFEVMAHHSSEFFPFMDFINFYTYFFIFYYLFRTFTKILVTLRLEDNQKYFPGILPFFYIIYKYEFVNEGISIIVQKKSFFLTSKVLYRNQAILEPEEKTLFKKAIELLNERYYYAKWTFLPIFFRENGVFSVKFFFVETIVRGRTHFIQYNFEKYSQQYVDSLRGYGSIYTYN